VDAAALSLNIDSSSVVKAANDLDRFSAASDRAGKAGAGIGNQSGSIAKLVASLQSMDAKLSTIIGGLDKVNSALSTNAKASQGAAAANDNVARSIGVADAHVIAYTQNLARLAAQQGDANAHVIAWQQSLQGSVVPQQQLNSHVEAYRRNLAQLPPAMDQASKSAGALQANTGNIAAQFQDIGVTAAMGMNPLIIGLQQGTQLSAVFAQSGGSMRDVLVGAFKQIASAQALLTIGLVALIAVAIQLAMAWFNSGSEADKLAKRIEGIKTASDGVSSAQSILGGVFDLTTGKMKTQTAAAINLAKAQLLLMKATAQSNISKASKDLDNSGNLGFMGRLSAWVKGDQGLIEGSARVDALTKALKNNQIGGTEAMKGFQMLYDQGKITNEMFLKGSAAAANYGAEIENVKTATQALADLDRGKLSAQFMNPAAAKKPPKGPKSDAEKLPDVYASANADIAAEKARALAAANNETAFETARLEKATALLNAIQQKGIPITDAVRAKVAALADEYAKFKIAADVSIALNAANDDVEKQRAAIADQAKLTGLYGDKLARVTRELEAQRKLRDSLPKGEIVVAPNLTGALSDDIETAARSTRMEKMRKDAEDSSYAMDLERKGLALTGEAAIAYDFTVQRLNDAKRAGIDLSPDEIAAINAVGAAYAAQRYAIDQQAKAIADQREVAKGFFTDWINGARQGQSVFKSFADSAVNSLNKIIDKLFDKTLDGFLNGGMTGGAGSSGGGFFSSLLGALGIGGNKNAGSSGELHNATFGGGSQGNPSGVLSFFAQGGAFDRAQRFANGGAFTNSVVNSPTLFRFANGGALGEMGEAGPEAIMPLKRGANGSLGVQMHGGGKPSVRMGDYNPSFSFAGAVGLDGIASMVRQGGEATYNQMKRDLQSLLQQLDTDGTFAS
jgi:lambda family phage tail tape measure protein